MNVKKFRQQIREYRKILNQKNNTIGSIIKHHRKEQKLTLEDASDGICSVSYLCKVEKNQLIPSKKILPEIIEKLSIKEIGLFEQTSSSWIDEIMIEELVPDKFYKDAINANDYRSKLILYAYEVLNSTDYTKAYQKYLELTSYFSHFSENEMVFFLYLVMKVSFMQEKYIDITTLYKEFNDFENVDRVIIQVTVLHLKSIYKIGNESLISQMQKTVSNQLIQYNDFKSLETIRSYHLAFDGKKLSTDQLSDKIKTLKKLDNKDLNYIWFNHYYKTSKFDKALNYIRKIHLLNDHYYIMYLITLWELKKGEELEIALLIPFDNIRTSYKIVKKLLSVSDEDKIDYVRNTVVYSNLLTQEKDILKFLYKEAIYELKAKYLYKEAVHVLEKYNNILQEINTVII